MSVTFVGPGAPTLTPEMEELIAEYRRQDEDALRRFIAAADAYGAPPGLVGSAAMSVAVERAAVVYVGMERNGCAAPQARVEETTLTAFRVNVEGYRALSRRAAS